MATAESSIGRRAERVAGGRSRGSLRLETLLPAGLTVLVALLVLYPMGMVVLGSFWSAAPGQPGTLTLENWRSVLGDSATFEVLLTSLVIAVPRTLLALALATIFAWCIARTNTPFKRLLEGLLVFMFFLPELPWVLAWMLLGAPNVGLLNQWLGALVPGGEGLIDVYSYGGLIVLGAARSAPVLFLFVHPALLAMDATLEEAARMAGASAWRTVWRINFPLLLPALLASGILSFVVAMESFEIPQLLGTPANIFVFTTRIYDLAYGGHVANFGAAMVLALILLVLTGSLIVVQWRLLRGRAYTTVSGRGFKAQPLDLGAGRWIAFAVILGFFIVFGALPMVVLLLNSFMELSGFITWEMFTTQHWANALGRDDVLKSVRDTLVVGIAAATLGVVVSLFISYVVTRTAWRGRRVLDMMAWGPWAIPGLVMSLGFLWAFVWLPIYGTLWVVVLALVARGLPVASRFFTGTMVQLSAELEESARVHGGSWLRTFLRIWLPLLRPAVIGAWILLFVIAVRVLDVVVLLAGPGVRMLSVDIFLWTVTGRQEAGSVLALIQTALVIVGYVAVRLIARRTLQQSAH
ncbi:MAG: ABC transporter permease subunit [Rhodospirillales bacterium]|nr:ABC transporter permease subunit [Rhodospirillales bacterium]